METGTRTQTQDAPPLDAAYTVLRNDRRRRVVRVLAERDGIVSLREVAAAVVARETGDHPTEVPAAAIADAALTLRHVHLPMLADLGVVAYDADANVVTSARPGTLRSLLGLVDDL